MTEQHIIVASSNPVKVRAVAQAFRRMFPQIVFQVEGREVDSRVSRQPISDLETLQGARNRVAAVQAGEPGADFWVGVEGGIDETPGGLAAFAWIVVRGRAQEGVSRSGSFQLAPPVAALIRAGMELGDADDQVFGQSNSKQVNGGVGLLTGDVVDRTALYEQAVILALIPFKNPRLYPAGEEAS